MDAVEGEGGRVQNVGLRTYMRSCLRVRLHHDKTGEFTGPDGGVWCDFPVGCGNDIVHGGEYTGNAIVELG